MNEALHARVRHIFAREFDRRGLLTWDMMLALQSALEEHRSPAPGSPAFDRRPRMGQIPNICQGGLSKGTRGSRE
ncbi:MAG: hypothetical protein ABSE62_17105 [Chthoniobacteraceae bacterium]|jgi:hypothetical protein